MRHIRKTHPPKQLTNWFKDNKAKGLDVSYEDGLSGKPAHKHLKAQLLKEQGHLCAYTGREIEASTSHVEHLKPREVCEGHEDVDYFNLVACFPANGGDESFGYGAPLKKSWWSRDLFISPCNPEVERRFKFNWSGKISVAPAAHEGALNTISVLGLDNRALEDMRKCAIMAFFGFGKNGPPIKVSEAKLLLERIDTPDKSGKLTAFSFAIRQLLQRYIQSAES